MAGLRRNIRVRKPRGVPQPCRCPVVTVGLEALIAAGTLMRAMIVIMLLAVTAALAWYAGPRVARDTTITFDPSTIGDDAEAWLAGREAQVPGLRDGLRKEIVWAYPASRAKTPLAIVYIHGFSASQREIRPVPDLVAQALGANLFYTRLTGHGGTSASMAEASVNAWINDYAEAVAVGKRLGERVVVIAASTGASIATWAATRPEFRDGIAALVLISPNYGVQATGASLLAGPWGARIARLVVGAERGFEPVNELHARYWTYRYPIEATLPMAAIVDMAAAAPVETIATPALFILSDKDGVVRPADTRALAARWGAPHRLVAVESSDDPVNHVIAGDVLSPANNTMVTRTIVDWITALP